MTKPAGRVSWQKGEQRHGWHLLDGGSLTTSTNTLNVNVAQLLLESDFRDLRLMVRGTVQSTQFAGSSTPQVFYFKFATTDGTTLSSATEYFCWSQAFTSTMAGNATGFATDLPRFFAGATVAIGGATAPGTPGTDIDFLVRGFQSASRLKSFEWAINSQGTATNVFVGAFGHGRWQNSGGITFLQIGGPSGSVFAGGAWELWGLKGFLPNFS